MRELLGQIFDLLDRKVLRWLVWLSVLFLVNSVFESFGVALVFALFQLIVDPAAMEGSEALNYVATILPIESASELIGLLCVVLFLLFVAKSGLYLFAVWQRATLEWQVRENASTLLLDGYLRSPYALHLRRQPTDLYNNVHTSVGFLCQSVVRITELVSDALMLIAISAMLLYLQFTTTIAALTVFGIIGALYVAVSQRHFRHWGRINKETAALLFQVVSEALTGIKQVKTLGAEGFFSGLYRKRIVVAAWAAIRNAFYGQVLKPVLEVLVIGGLLGAIGFMLIQERAPAEIVPLLAMLGAAAYRVMPAVARISNSLQGLHYAQPAIAAIHEDIMGFRQGRLPLLAPSPTERQEFKSEIGLENVSASYDNAGEPALEGVSLTIRRGDSVGLVGPSGAGKTTLADVILGLVAPSSGRIRIDGEVVGPNQGVRPRLFGYVPQETFLIDASIRRNVALGEDEEAIDDARVRKALAAAALDGFVDSLPKGPGTMVGERGMRLSGGQRQRLAIARALYHDPDILVFDEATSSLDITTESEVTDAIHRLGGAKTLIIIAHRLSTVKDCNRLFYLEQGRLVDSGSFAELARRNPSFRVMVRQMHLDTPEDGETVTALEAGG